MSIRIAIRLSCIAVALAATACHGREAAPPPPVPVTVRVVESAASGNGGAYSANIVPDIKVDLAFKVNGYVASIMQVKGADGRMRNVQTGDRVKQGNVLAAIREDSYRQKVLEAQAQLQGAKATAARTKKDFDRYAMLLKERVSSKADYDAAKQQYESYAAQVGAADASLKHAQTDLDDCKLKSPLDGIVLSRKIEVGTLVDQSAKAFEVADTQAMKVVFGVPDMVLPSLHEGDQVDIKTEAIPGVGFRGRITKVAAVSDPDTRLFDIEVTIPNSDGRLKSGMVAALNLGMALQAIAEPVVPLRSVVRPPSDPRGYAVYEVEDRDGKSFARLTTVQLGPMAGDGIAIKSGLKLGDKVIVQGATIVTDGQQVNVVQ
ncbi:MAG TPA: efflux RND transporter periplasmic adaptor subunit [Candidatus Binataceae bacterium]